MVLNSKTLRYHLPKKAIKVDCPQCGPRHRKTLSRYIDTQTGEPLPEDFGRCDRESNCGYHYSPYQKDVNGLSYAEAVYQQFKTDNEHTHRKHYYTNRPALKPTQPEQIYTIPNAVFQKSLGQYENNQFARLLCQQFGKRKADELLTRFQVGTSSRWPGACVFWYIDEQGRKRGGQIKLFRTDWHTAKYIDREGEQRSKTSWVHSALKYRLEKEGKTLPEWLVKYDEKADRSPCLFGLPQLLTEPTNKPIAIVEAPKTAIVCTSFLPDFTWLAIGGKSYLNAERMAPVKGRKVTLYPDLNACSDWQKRAELLRQIGFQIGVSDYLESNATEDQKRAGLDLADFLLEMAPTVTTIAEQLANPAASLKPDESQIERLTVAPVDAYPPEWDEPNAPDAKPRIRQQSLQKDPYFSLMGIQPLELVSHD